MLLQRKPACACGGGCPRCQTERDLEETLPIQTKLKISQPGDKYEQEADRVAEQVMRMPEPKVSESGATAPAGEGMLQTKSAPNQHPTSSLAVSPSIIALQGRSQPLPQSERAFFEHLFAADFSQVRIHADTRAAKMAQSVNARAFTIGQDIVFGAGQYEMESREGRRLLAHELTHVIQQSEQDFPMLMRSCPCAEFSTGLRQDREPTNDEHRYIQADFPQLELGDYCMLEGSYLAFNIAPEQVTQQGHANRRFLCYGWSVDNTAQQGESGHIDEQYIMSQYGKRNYEGENSLRMTDLQAFYSDHGFPLTGRIHSADILVYGTGIIPKHVAKKSSIECEGQQMYTSKLGVGSPLIAHLPDQLEGGKYGNIMGGFSRSSVSYMQFRLQPTEEELQYLRQIRTRWHPNPQ